MLTRRTALTLFGAGLVLPTPSLAETPKTVMWEDLIPADIPYAEIIGQGEMDMEADTWNPVYDENATKLNETLNGAYVKIPGYIIPMEIGNNGVTDFMLVPYVGACIHTPPPPANQLVLVNAKEPWPSDQLWDAVWVIGFLSTQLQSTELGETGYALSADAMEIYEW